MTFELNDNLTHSALALIDGEKNLVANLANLSSLIFHGIPGLNWAGFYLWEESSQELVLGPFQGRPACIRIPPTRGVCGRAYSTQKIQRIDDVHEFEGHIACDPESRSELVIPLVTRGKCWGVFDLDSPTLAFFTQDLEDELSKLFEELSLRLS